MAQRQQSRLEVVVSGGGPSGLVFAIRIVEYLRSRVHVRIYDGRWMPDPAKPGFIIWKGEAEGNKRRPQVVTIQDDVSALLSSRTAAEFFRIHNERAWPTSRQIAIREVEDRMLERIQQDDIRGSITFNMRNMDKDELDKLAGSYDVIVGADGGRFLRNQMPYFNPRSVGGDYGMGIAFTLPPGMQPQPQSLNIILTVSQTRYLLNSYEGRTGFLNMRLDEAEWKQLVDLEGNACNFANWGLVRRSDGSMDGPPGKQIRPQAMNNSFWERITDGLKMFRIPVDCVQGILGIPINVEYCDHFVTEVSGVQNPRGSGPAIAAVIGDSAFRVHFWPGRGLNSGIKAGVSLARALYWNTTTDTYRGALRPQDFWKYEAFMQALRLREEEGRSMPVVEMRDQGQPYPTPERLQRAREDWWSGTSHFDDFVKTCREMQNALESNTARWRHPKLEIDFAQYLRGCNLEGLTFSVMHCSGTWPRAAMAGDEVSPSVLFARPNDAQTQARVTGEFGPLIRTALQQGTMRVEDVAQIANGTERSPIVYDNPQDDPQRKNVIPRGQEASAPPAAPLGGAARSATPPPRQQPSPPPQVARQQPSPPPQPSPVQQQASGLRFEQVAPYNPNAAAQPQQQVRREPVAAFNPQAGGAAYAQPYAQRTPSPHRPQQNPSALAAAQQQVRRSSRSPSPPPRQHVQGQPQQQQQPHRPSQPQPVAGWPPQQAAGAAPQYVVHGATPAYGGQYVVPQQGHVVVQGGYMGQVQGGAYAGVPQQGVPGATPYGWPAYTPGAR